MRIGMAVFALVVASWLPAPARACMNGDANPICDDVGPCHAPEPHALREPHVSVSRTLGGGGDAIVRFDGIVPLFDDEPADPAATGLRLIVREGAGGPSHVVVDLALAPSAGWVTRRPGEWIYRNPMAFDARACARSCRCRRIRPSARTSCRSTPARARTSHRTPSGTR
jgi:hypothetical protein